MTNTQRAMSFVVLTATLSLAGCGNGGPSSSDVRKLIEADQARNMAMISSLAGSGVSETVRSNMPKVEDLDVKSCDEAGENIYRCNVEITVSLRGETVNQTVTETFSKGKDGDWAIAR